MNTTLKPDLLCLNPGSTTWTIAYLVCFFKAPYVQNGASNSTYLLALQGYESIGVRSLNSSCCIVKCWLFLLLLILFMILLLLLLLDWEVGGLGLVLAFTYV